MQFNIGRNGLGSAQDLGADAIRVARLSATIVCQQEDHALAATNKPLAQSNKSEAEGKATKHRRPNTLGGGDHELRSARRLSSGLQETPHRVPQVSDRINAERERAR